MSGQVERLNVWITTVIYESRLISIKHRVEAKGEKFVVVDFLNNLLFFVTLGQIIQVKKVRKAVSVVKGASHVALLF